jgi:hypothetical protein
VKPELSKGAGRGGGLDDDELSIDLFLTVL